MPPTLGTQLSFWCSLTQPWSRPHLGMYIYTCVCMNIYIFFFSFTDMRRKSAQMRWDAFAVNSCLFLQVRSSQLHSFTFYTERYLETRQYYFPVCLTHYFQEKIQTEYPCRQYLNFLSIWVVGQLAQWHRNSSHFAALSGSRGPWHNWQCTGLFMQLWLLPCSSLQRADRNNLIFSWISVRMPVFWCRTDSNCAA